MDVRDCDGVIMRVNYFSRRLGWERFEEIVEMIEHEIEVFTNKPLRGRVQFPNRIRQRTMFRLGGVRHAILRINDVHDGVVAEEFFARLAAKIYARLGAALEMKFHP